MIYIYGKIDFDIKKVGKELKEFNDDKALTFYIIK